MKIAKYLSSLLSSFDRAQVIEDIRLLKEELNENTLPPFQAAAEHYQRERFSARSVQDFNAIAVKAVRTDVRGDFLAITAVALTRGDEVLDFLSGKIDKEFARDITAEGMTYLRANILRYIEVVSFTLRYSRKVLMWTYAEEAQQLTGKKNTALTKAELSWLMANRDVFFRALNILSVKPKEAERFFKNIPNMVIIPEETETVEQTVGLAKLDPFQMNLIPVKLNPIYHVRMAIAEWQVNRYRAAQEEKKALEYRLLALREMREGGHTDAKLEQTIEYTEGRLQKLNFKMAQMEED